MHGCRFLRFEVSNSLFKLFNNRVHIYKQLFMSKSQSVKAVAKYIRMSPHKIRRVLDQIRGRSYQEALMILEFLPYDAGGPIWQVVHSAAANAKHNYGLDKKKLIIDEIFADEGPKLKRIRPRAQGRAYKILKPTCHITVIMKEEN
jgi:large subunit ribosomal protein L22